MKKKAKPEPPILREQIKTGSYINTRYGLFQVIGGLGDLVIVRERNREWIALKLAAKALFRRILRLGARP